jgi:hypothetical protein
VCSWHAHAGARLGARARQGGCSGSASTAGGDGGATGASPNGRFTVSALRSTKLDSPTTGRGRRERLTVELPLQVQRLTQNAWRSVARTTGSFKRSLKPGSYRVKVLGGADYSPAVSRPVGLH